MSEYMRGSRSLHAQKEKKIPAFLHKRIYEPFIVETPMSSALKGAPVPGVVATLPWRRLV